MTVASDPQDVRVERLPGLVEHAAFGVAGFSRRFDLQTRGAIPALWGRLVQAMPFKGQAGHETYGVIWDVDPADGSFSYMAGGRLDPAAAAPAGLERKDVPGGAYAVFRITMAGGPPSPQFQAAMQTLWKELMPASGIVVRPAPEFELYADRRTPDQAGAEVDYYVPVEASQPAA